MQNNDKKFKTVIDKNTFYFYNPVFQEKYESYINSLKETLLVLKNKIETDGLKKEFFEALLLEKENGLRALLLFSALKLEHPEKDWIFTELDIFVTNQTDSF